MIRQCHLVGLDEIFCCALPVELARWSSAGRCVLTVVLGVGVSVKGAPSELTILYHQRSHPNASALHERLPVPPGERGSHSSWFCPTANTVRLTWNVRGYLGQGLLMEFLPSIQPHLTPATFPLAPLPHSGPLGTLKQKHNLTTLGNIPRYIIGIKFSTACVFQAI